MKVKELFESKGKSLKINLDNKKVTGDKNMLSQLSVDNISEFDSDDLTKDSEGNVGVF